MNRTHKPLPSYVRSLSARRDRKMFEYGAIAFMVTACLLTGFAAFVPFL